MNTIIKFKLKYTMKYQNYKFRDKFRFKIYDHKKYFLSYFENKEPI